VPDHRLVRPGPAWCSRVLQAAEWGNLLEPGTLHGQAEPCGGVG